MSVLLPVEHDKEGTYQLVGPDGIPRTWTWADLTWHGPDNRHPKDKVKMSAAFAYSQGYRFAQQPPSSPAPKPAAPDELLPEDAGKRAVYWLWNGEHKTRWSWGHEDRLWTQYGRLPAATMAPSEAWERGFRMSFVQEQPPESARQDGTPPRPPLYRMRAEGLTLEEYINTRREHVREMRKDANEKARSVRQALECADAIEAEILALSASLVRVNPGDLT